MEEKQMITHVREKTKSVDKRQENERKEEEMG